MINFIMLYGRTKFVELTCNLNKYLTPMVYY